MSVPIIDPAAPTVLDPVQAGVVGKVHGVLGVAKAIIAYLLAMITVVVSLPILPIPEGWHAAAGSVGAALTAAGVYLAKNQSSIEANTARLTAYVQHLLAEIHHPAAEPAAPPASDPTPVVINVAPGRHELPDEPVTEPVADPIVVDSGDDPPALPDLGDAEALAQAGAGPDTQGDTE